MKGDSDGASPEAVGTSAWGCLSCISFLEAAEDWSIPLETKALAALDNCPSWMSADARLAFLFSWLRGSALAAFFLPFFGGARCPFRASFQREAASPALHLLQASLTTWAADLPDDATSFGLALSTQRGKMYNRSHLFEFEGSAQTSPTVAPRIRAQSSRADLGMCLMVEMVELCASSHPGRPFSCQERV